MVLLVCWFGEKGAGRRTLLALVIFKSLEASKSSASGYKLMAETGLVLLEVVVVVDLLVRVLAVICGSVSGGKHEERQQCIPQKPMMMERLNKRSVVKRYV